jgi:hypothetical protein
MGPSGAAGAVGATGATGATGIVSTVVFNSVIANPNPAVNNTKYVFVGSTAVVTVAAGQRITAAASAVLGHKAAGVLEVRVGLCYQKAPNVTLINFVPGTTYMLAEITTSRTPFSVAASVDPGAGTYTIGFCAWNPTGVPLDDSDVVNGWAQVTN